MKPIPRTLIPHSDLFQHFLAHQFPNVSHQDSINSKFNHEILLQVSKQETLSMLPSTELETSMQLNDINSELSENSVIRTIKETDVILTKFKNHISKRNAELVSMLDSGLSSLGESENYLNANSASFDSYKNNP